MPVDEDSSSIEPAPTVPDVDWSQMCELALKAELSQPRPMDAHMTTPVTIEQISTSEYMPQTCTVADPWPEEDMVTHEYIPPGSTGVSEALAAAVNGQLCESLIPLDASIRAPSRAHVVTEEAWEATSIQLSQALNNSYRQHDRGAVISSFLDKYEADAISSYDPYTYQKNELGIVDPFVLDTEASPRSEYSVVVRDLNSMAVGSAAPVVRGAPATTVVVYGIPVSDAAVAKLTKKVLTISFAMAVLILIGFVFNWLASTISDHGIKAGSAASNVLNLVVGWSVPACGYFGARNKSRALLMCFWGWSLCWALYAGHVRACARALQTFVYYF
jgi:hypothetical protein